MSKATWRTFLPQCCCRRPHHAGVRGDRGRLAPLVGERVGEAANPGLRVPGPAPATPPRRPGGARARAGSGASDGSAEPDDAAPTPVADRRPKRRRAAGGEVCCQCEAVQRRDHWGYGCTACRVVFCEAACRRVGFPLYDCDAFGACRMREVPDDSPL